MTDFVSPPPTAKPSLAELTSVFARIGCLSFGGPAGQIGMMHRVLVDEKRWVSDARFMHALNYCMLLPGPEAQQLATYIGWLMHGVRGGIVAGTLFILPGFFAIVALAAAYCLYQDTHWLPGLLFGLKACVLAIVIEALIRVAKRALVSRFLAAIAAAAFIALFVFGLPFPLVIFAAGLLGFLRARRGDQSQQAETEDDAEATPVTLLSQVRGLVLGLVIWQIPLALIFLFSAPETLATLQSFFSRMAVVTFGGAYAVLAYVAQVAVETHGWLSPGEMLDGLALAEATPGPLVLVLPYIGFLAGFRHAEWLDPMVAGILGATVTAWATFVPSFIFIFLGAPYVEKLRNNRALSAALSAITAAVVGVILNLSIWFGLHVLFGEVIRLSIEPSFGPGISWPVWTTLDPFATGLLVLSLLMLMRWKVGMVPVLALGIAGGVLRLWLM
ncbi:chromate efflux transporter [Agrobacterium rubi]|uniref:Chromate efflux transporter n=1 Tax=Agrobacterium rubi TaxID=28099 RepID=A0AAE7R265_9HYPH|nr:chromate efflux transporter [Agrobacterium rubi]NTE85491.1 chromate efflux transporter [Agrobacterium rubi]NTF01423.1 chromate efflux transporter [Agrobacterium rubi]NTF35666.1 chromate efflux transporter [Agrobacterium rubi]OCJ48417.1 chromate transporter [Agrobacterium rubi]QTG00785.1 chromate efflux transporter [Agrobacterium rubi]